MAADASMTTAVQSLLSLSSRRVVCFACLVACARTSASHGGVAPSFLKRVSVLLFFRGLGCLACPSSPKGGGGFFCGQKESLCVSLFSERGLSFSFALLGMLDFLRFGANKNTEFLHKTVPVCTFFSVLVLVLWWCSFFTNSYQQHYY